MAVGVTEAIPPEPDGTIADVNRDFTGQGGVTNILASFLQCAPASGSLSATALNVAAGAETRAANLISGASSGGWSSSSRDRLPNRSRSRPSPAS